MRSRYVTIVVHTDDDLQTRQIRLPLVLFRITQASAIAVGILVLLFFAFAGPIFRSASRVRGLESEVGRLRADSARVGELAAELNRAERRYEELRDILGARAPAGSRGPAVSVALFARPLDARTPDAARRYSDGPSTPQHWPLEQSAGVVTRGQVREGTDAEAHPGLDIAIPPGTPVRAAGGGQVVATGANEDYGLFVLLRHPEGYETLYGHVSRLLVREGDDVPAGQVIALTGSTGRSTGPHLHFEVRRGGRSLDPLSVIKAGS